MALWPLVAVLGFLAIALVVMGGIAVAKQRRDAQEQRRLAQAAEDAYLIEQSTRILDEYATSDLKKAVLAGDEVRVAELRGEFSSEAVYHRAREQAEAYKQRWRALERLLEAAVGGDEEQVVSLREKHRRLSKDEQMALAIDAACNGRMRVVLDLIAQRAVEHPELVHAIAFQHAKGRYESRSFALSRHVHERVRLEGTLISDLIDESGLAVGRMGSSSRVILRFHAALGGAEELALAGLRHGARLAVFGLVEGAQGGGFFSRVRIYTVSVEAWELLD
jgi:hypothetical protein